MMSIKQFDVQRTIMQGLCMCSKEMAYIQDSRIHSDLLGLLHPPPHRLFSGHYLVQDNTKAEDVSLLCTFASNDELRSHPMKGPSFLHRAVILVLPMHIPLYNIVELPIGRFFIGDV